MASEEIKDLSDATNHQLSLNDVSDTEPTSGGEDVAENVLQAATPASNKGSVSTLGTSNESLPTNGTSNESLATNGSLSKDTNTGVATAADSAPNKATIKSLPKPFKENFKLFSKFGDTKSDGKLVTLSQSDKWMKQAKVIDGKKVTTTDTGIYFKKFKSLKIGLTDYQKFMESLAKHKNVSPDEWIQKMTHCGPPAANSSSIPSTHIDDTVSRLTDPSKYTGSHKLRFDEQGKGKGLAGRKDVVESQGYVQGYQNRNSYDKTH